MTKRTPLKIPSGDELDALLAIDLWRQGDRGDGGAWLKRRQKAGRISEHEQKLIDDLIDGTAKKRRPTSTAETLSVRLEIAKSVMMLERARPREKRTTVVRLVADVFGVSPRLVQSVLREFAGK